MDASMRPKCTMKKKKGKTNMSEYVLYDVPWLVREANGRYCSKTRHKIEKRNQAVVDDYFVARDRGSTAEEARRLVAEKHRTSILQVVHCLRWYYQEAVRRGKITFLQKFPPEKEHIVHFDIIFAPDLRKRVNIA